MTKYKDGRKREILTQRKDKLKPIHPPNETMDSDLTLAELDDAIRRLKCKKSPGKDGVCNEMIKHLGPAARKKLLELFNLSWRTGVFPPAWSAGQRSCPRAAA